MWQQNYTPVASSLGISAPLAAIPILVLFVMLGVLRKPAWMAAVSALVSALVVALGVYKMPVSLALASTLYGAATGLFPIAWIVFTAIMLYRLTVDVGGFEIIKDSVGGLTSDRRLQGDADRLRVRRVHRGRGRLSARPSPSRAPCWRAWASRPSSRPASACSPTRRPSPSARWASP
jgi:hypothetical protein